MNYKWIILFLVSSVSAFVFISCRHEPLVPLSDAPVISFVNDVDPIITSNCTESGCHGAGGHRPQLINYEDILGEVSPGNPYSSSLFDVITSNVVNTMPKPPNPRLTNTQIKTIFLWISQGAQNN